MARKYLGRRNEKLSGEQVDNENIDNLDPFDAKERKFSLAKNESKNEQIGDIDNADEYSKNSTEFDEVTGNDFKIRMERIEKIKKMHENFDRELKKLKNESTTSLPNSEFEKATTSEVVNLGKDITDLITKSSDQKIKILELQLENERKRTTALNSIIEENVEKIVTVEKELQMKIGQEVRDLVANDGKQKIRVMELQLENEKQHSKKIQNVVSDKVSQINIHDEEIRKIKDNLELEVEEKTQKLIQAERLSAIGELAARVAHDLRNPLSVIKASVELIKVKNTAANENTFLIRQVSMIERAISRMSHQIEDVLDFVRPIPLQVMTNSIMRTLKQSIEKVKTSDEVELILPDNDIEFEFDKDKIDVVFDNLLTNAFQAIKDHGIISVRFIDGGDFVNIEFEDSGPGIPEDVLPRIFEPLVTTKQTGTGLGLASCKSIISQHGGSISVKNKPTRFIIELPKSQRKKKQK